MATSSYPANEGMQAMPAYEGIQVNVWQAAPSALPKEEPKYYIEQRPYMEVKHDDFQTTTPSTIFGLRKRNFWIVLVGVLVVVAVVGGVCGSVVSKNKSVEKQRAATSQTASATSAASATSTFSTLSSATSSISSSTSSSTIATSTLSSSTSSTASSLTATATSGILTLDCPSINNTLYSTVPSGSTVNSTFEIFCNTNYNTATNVAVTSALTIDQCMDDCAKQNTGLGGCKGLVFNRNLTLVSSLDLAGNCFLKGDVSDVQNDSSGNGAGAILVSTS